MAMRMALWPLFAATKGLAQVSSACRLASNEAAKVLEGVPPERMRNFSVISHVDHGKSTLSDRLMELTGAIRGGGTQQYLDRLPVERDRGITVKAQTASLLHSEAGDQFLLNLIDTPGHADFAYEVSRSLEACQGCLLLVDATQGVQAQTLANFYLALDKDLEIIPVLNKVDAASAEPEETALQISSVFGLAEEEIIPVSAKTGWNVGEVLRAIVSRIPSPSKADPNLPARGLLLDSHYNSYRGAITLVYVKEGKFHTGQRIASKATGEEHEASELGFLAPEAVPCARLSAGQVGYMVTGVRSPQAARIGDTLHLAGECVEALPGFQPAKPAVFQGLYPASADAYDSLRQAVEKLAMNDSSVSLSSESSAALGLGFRAGFLGLLHADVFHQRLREEFGEDVIATAPTVPYRLVMPSGEVQEIRMPSHLPENLRGYAVEEPIVEASVVCPGDHVGRVIELLAERRGEQLEHSFLDSKRCLLRNTLPLAEMATDLVDQLKKATSGYASLEYSDAGFQRAAVERMDVLLNGERVDVLASVVHRSKAYERGRQLCSKLKSLLPRHMFEVRIQASCGGVVVASERIPPIRRNVLSKCYGGDVSRKKKLLEKQKEGKKKLKRFGSVELPENAFKEVLRTDSPDS